MSADSAHKTLPVLTGGAWLNIADESYLADARAAMALFGSTSPSYLIMLSLDLCRAWLAQSGVDAMAKLAAQTESIKQSAQKKGFVFPQGECDPLRLAFNTAAVGLAGDKAGQILQSNHIEPEYAGREGVILIPSPFNPPVDFERLEAALEKMTAYFQDHGPMLTESISSGQEPEVRLTPRQALLAQYVRLAVEKSVGKVAHSAVCPCPPAIPIVMPGEVITRQSASLLAVHGYSNINVVK
ncbi:MAG TPA: amino acid decarboxylase, partial [Clostridia bacterium]|nr:amino acid decarboxylase [Clostridia bacterium]